MILTLFQTVKRHLLSLTNAVKIYFHTCVNVGNKGKYCENSGDFDRRDVTSIKPDQERILIGIGDWTNMDQVAGAKVDNYSWECQSNDEMTRMSATGGGKYVKG